MEREAQAVRGDMTVSTCRSLRPSWGAFWVLSAWHTWRGLFFLEISLGH